MTRKRKAFPKRRLTPRKQEKDSKGFHHHKINNLIITELYKEDNALSINDLVKILNLPRKGKKTIEEALAFLCQQKIVFKSDRKHFSLHRNRQYIEATIDRHPDGFGFGTDITLRAQTRPLTKEPYVSAARMSSALHGDRVLLSIIRLRRNGRAEAEVIGVIKRKTKQLAGIYHQHHNEHTVYPDDLKFPSPIVIAAPADLHINNGDAVIVTLIDQDNAHGRLHGKITEVLGSPDNIDVQMRFVVEKFRLPATFSSQVQKEAETVVPAPGPDDREDLREALHFTVDGKTAKDFDDAIAVEKNQQGYRLFVSIADVSAFVKPGSLIDREAYERGTSIYFPSTVIPMLPENLSNNLCSLLPNADRLTVTVILDFNHQGKLLKSRFTRSVIRSSQRFTYDTVKQLIIDKEPSIRRNHKPYLTPLKWAAELAKLLRSKRRERGSITFTLTEAEIQLDSLGKVSSITRAQNHFGHQIIEEFMLAANEAVAETFAKAERPMLFRIHEEPDSEKMTDFRKFSERFGLELPKETATPKWYNGVIDHVRGTAGEYVINTLLLRTMQQARYSPDNKGHFGLAAEYYTHFTSPIRRYPDLIVHRLVCDSLVNHVQSQKQSTSASPADSLKLAGTYLSERERLAISSEREMADRLKCQYMSGRIGDSFQAVISGVSDTVFFVELLDVFVSGAVSLATLLDDYYLLDKKNHRLIGDVTGNILQLGDCIEVVLLDVEQDKNRLSFTLKQANCQPPR